jgi:hypothetical protein
MNNLDKLEIGTLLVAATLMWGIQLFADEMVVVREALQEWHEVDYDYTTDMKKENNLTQ